MAGRAPALPALLLTAYARWFPAPVPMRSVAYHQPPDKPRRAACSSPGWVTAENFENHGFIGEVKQRGLSVDMIAANATLGYYARAAEGGRDERGQLPARSGLYLLKKLDLAPEDGRFELPVVLPSELSPLDEALQQLAVNDLIAINAQKNRYELAQQASRTSAA